METTELQLLTLRRWQRDRNWIADAADAAAALPLEDANTLSGIDEDSIAAAGCVQSSSACEEPPASPAPLPSPILHLPLGLTSTCRLWGSDAQCRGWSEKSREAMVAVSVSPSVVAAKPPMTLPPKICITPIATECKQKKKGERKMYTRNGTKALVRNAQRTVTPQSGMEKMHHHYCELNATFLLLHFSHCLLYMILPKMFVLPLLSFPPPPLISTST